MGAQPCSFIYVLLTDAFLWRKQGWGSCNRDQTNHKAQNICRLALCRKCLQTPGQRLFPSLLCQNDFVYSLWIMWWPGEWGLGVASFDWLYLMSSSCELRGLFPLRFSGGSSPGLSQFPHTHVLINTCLKSQGGSHANLPFSPCTALCFLCTVPYILEPPWSLFVFLDSPQSGKAAGRHLRSTFPMPWPGTLKPMIWDWELISFVSQISGITALYFLTSASWNCCFVYFACGFVYCFVFSLFGARSKSAPCQPLLSRSRSLTLFWTPFSQWKYLAHEVLVLLNHFNSMVSHPLSCLKQSEEAENSAPLHVAQLFICSDLLFGIHGSWKECLDS